MNRNFLIAMLFSMLIIMAYSTYNHKVQQDYYREHPEYLERLKNQRLQGATISNGTDEASLSSSNIPEVSGQPISQLPLVGDTRISKDLPPTSETIEVSSPLYHIEIAAQGGRPQSWKMRKYPEIVDDISLLENYRKKLSLEPQTSQLERQKDFLDRKIEVAKEIQERIKTEKPKKNEEGYWDLDFAAELMPNLWNNQPPLNLKWYGESIDQYIPYQSNVSHLNVTEGTGVLELRGVNGPFEITKIFEFRPDDYAIDYSISIRNISSATIDLSGDLKSEKSLSLTWDDGIALNLFTDSWSPPVYFQISNSIKIESKVYGLQSARESTLIDWALLQSKYFGAFIVPEGKVLPRVVKKRPQYDHGALDLVLDLGRLAPGGEKREKFRIYIGPKDPPHLRQFGHNAGDILFLGFFRRMAKPFGLFFWWLLHSIQLIVGNWGVAIIILTILTKMGMYPLMRKQMQSMKNMQRIQPMVKELEKFKENQAKYQKELMALYKREKVNPAGGCLPLLLTMPIFIALYVVIYIAPELRGASFLWIRDLSQPDSLFSFYLPGLNWVIRLNVLPIINGVYQYFAQKKQIVDPKQAGMMQMMPVIFVFLFWNFPSGLVLYWIMQAVLGTLQQSIFNHLHEKENARRKPDSGKSGLLATRTAKKVKK